MTSMVLLAILTQFEPPPGATGQVERQSNGTMCFVVADEDGALSELCRSEFGDYPRPLSSKAVDDPLGSSRKPVAAQVEELNQKPEAHEAGSQFGVVSLAAGSVAIGTRVTSAPLSDPQLGPTLAGAGLIVGVGVRVGLKDRQRYERMLMPTLAVVVGTSLQSNGTFSPFLELRGELVSVSPSGPLQPNFLIYGTTGAGSTPLGRGRAFSVQPHIGVGLGWNWVPRGGGGGSWVSLGSLGSGGGAGALVAIPIALAIVGMIFAGRVEVRYTARPVSGPGSDFVSVMVGFGS